MKTLPWVSLGVAAASAIAAWQSAVAARRSAAASERSSDTAHKASQAALLNSLLMEFASPDMLLAIRKARSWVVGEPIPMAGEMDLARRRVAHYFHRVAAFYRNGLLGKELIGIAATREQVALFCQVIEPMEEALNKGYSKEDFDLLASMYGGRQHLPTVPDRSIASW